MNCPACGIALADGAAFCHVCGAKADGSHSAREEHDAPSSPFRPAGRTDDPELELWKGGYSPKAMYGAFFLTAVVSVLLVIGGVLLMSAWSPALYAALGLSVLLWLWTLGVLMYRRMSIHYRLTSQRFFHETGIVVRRTDRVEVISMSDVAFTQGPMERLLGVGTITISSSDRTHPELVMRGIADVRHVSEIIDKARRKEITRRGVRIESV